MNQTNTIIHIATLFLLSLISIANSQETVFSSLTFQTTGLAVSGTSATVTMNVWLDGIIYQCQFTGPISADAQVECDDAAVSVVGSYCDDSLDGQLLIANDNSDGIHISEISLVVASASDPFDLTEYGITGWCVDPGIPTGGAMQTGGNCPGNRNVCGLNLVNTCGVGFNDHHAICINNVAGASGCAPAFQQMYFDFDCSMTSAVDVEWMDGSETTITDDTCQPSIAPSSQTQTPTNNPTKVPTNNPTESSESGESSDDQK